MTFSSVELRSMSRTRGGAAWLELLRILPAAVELLDMNTVEY